MQSFYLFINGDIDGNDLEEGDWIGAFHGGICVGSRQWEGAYTPVPAMGNDGSQYTIGYLDEGSIPSFKIYDASLNVYYTATPGFNESQNYGFTNLATWIIDDISVIDDCAGTLGGLAFFDDCDDNNWGGNIDDTPATKDVYYGTVTSSTNNNTCNDLNYSNSVN